MLTAPFNLQDFDFTFGADEVEVVEENASPAPGSTFPAIFNDGFVDALPGDDVIHGAITGFDEADDVDFIGFSNSGTLLTSFGDDEVSGAVDFKQAFPRDFSGESTGIGGRVTGLINTGFGEDEVEGTVSLDDRRFAEPTPIEKPTLFGVGIRDITLLMGADDDKASGATSFSSGGSATVSGRGITGLAVNAGLGDDELHGSIEATSRSSLHVADAGLTGLRFSDVKMGAGDDVVSAEATVEAALKRTSGAFVEIGAIRSTDIFLGAGDDELIAEVDVEGETDDGVGANVAAEGIRASDRIAWGSGEDAIEVSVDVETDGDILANGIRSSLIGDGRFGAKTLDVEVSASSSGLAVVANGLFNTTVETGRADDQIKVDVDATGTGEGDLVSAVGVFLGEIKTGNGTDELDVSATADGATSVVADAVGLLGATIIGGFGRDVVEAEATATGRQAEAIGIGGQSDIDTAGAVGNDVPFGANDLVSGYATATGSLATARGIADTDVRTGGGADAVNGEAEATASGPAPAALATGISGNGEISIETGRRDDNVYATATAEASGPDAEATAFGITSDPGEEGKILIATGPGADTVIASGTASARGIDAVALGIGISSATIETGDGVDLVEARGSTIGVNDVHIDGGAGGDFFDLQSGNGFVDGGLGLDTLILAGSRDDFDFSFVDGDLQITDAATSGGVTDLLVTRVERFEFQDDDGVASLADILVV